MMAGTKITLVGLAGTNGSGKDTVGQILDSRFGFLFISVTDLLREETRRRELPQSRQNNRLVSAEWRRLYGLAVLIDKAVAEYEAARVRYSGLVMASLRNPGEADRLHELGGQLIWLDADPKIRYRRVIDNAHLRKRSADDDISFKEFLAEEKAEMTPPKDADPAHLHMAAVKDKADIFIDNSDLTLEELTDVIGDKLHLE